MPFDFDDPIDRRRTNCVKWDGMERQYGVPSEDGIAMWVADMDFRAPPCVNQTLRNLADHGVHGYLGDDSAYLASIVNWMGTRHGWDVSPDWISSTHGLVNGIGLCLQAFTGPDDAVILFTPVYHAFHKVIRANGRRIHESPLVQEDGLYRMDLHALGAGLMGDERMLVLCSPHNPGGRVWTREELRAVAEFCAERDLILLSDEVHHDLVYPGHTHTVMPLAAPDITDRLIMATGATKAFNLAGALTGNIIIPDDGLRARFQKVAAAAAIHPDRIGALMVTAAYAHGAEWLAALLDYLDANRRAFDDGVNAIPGLRSMELQSTYLAWVDFSGTGMAPKEFIARVERDAKIAANHGDTFGTGGESFLRFNLATRRALIDEAVERLATAFADLQ